MNRKETATLELIRENALKLIPDDFNEQDLKKLLELIKRLGNLTQEDREALFNDIGNIGPEEIAARLEKGKKPREKKLNKEKK